MHMLFLLSFCPFKARPSVCVSTEPCCCCVCVSEPVPEPTVMVECVKNGFNLSCSSLNSSEVSVSWTKNGEKSDTTHAALHVSSSELTPGDTFSCTLRNMISRSSAKDVQPKCSDTGYIAEQITSHVYSHLGQHWANYIYITLKGPHATNANEDSKKEENNNNKNINDGNCFCHKDHVFCH